MSEIQSVVNSLLIRAANQDPVMVSIIQEILDELMRIGVIVDPEPIVQAKLSGEGLARAVPTPVTDITYRLTSRNVILEWTPSTTDFTFYEIRKGTVWDTATRVLVTSELRAVLDPLTTGTHTYLIKALSPQGLYSEDFDSVDVIISGIGTPTIDFTVLDQNVLLRWTTPTSVFTIDHYDISRNGNAFSKSGSNFHVIIESAGGEYVYGIKAIDIAGNEGPEATITILINQPADFILYATQTADFSGTLNNAREDNNRLLLPINTTESYEEHFVNNSWDSPQDQIDAGYPRWVHPTPETAYYEHIFDYGTIFTSVIVSLSWVFEIIEGEFTFGIEAYVSDDNVSYSTVYDTQNFFAPSVRYLKVRMNFTGSDDKALLWFYNFTANLSIREEMDSGSVIADALDTDGTVVTFNKEFYDITSITVTVNSEREPIDAIFTFDDVPNPTSFNVYAYDFAGNRVTKQVDWKVRGIV